MIDEQVKENNQDKESWVLIRIHVPGEFQELRSLVGCHLWGHTELDMTEVT